MIYFRFAKQICNRTLLEQIKKIRKNVRKMKKYYLWLTVFILSISIAASFTLASCKSEKVVDVEEAVEEAVEEVAEEEVEEEAEEVAEIKTTGPQGQVPVWYSEIELTEEEEVKISDGSFKVAYDQATPNEFNDTIGKAIESRCNELGMEYVAETMNNMNPATQVENIENMLALDPDIIVALSVDPVTSREIFKKASEQGVVLVFASNKPGDFEWKTDYTGGLIIFDFYEFGSILAEGLNEALNGEGKIGYLYHEAEFFITNQRDEGFKEAIDEYSGLEIVAEVPWSGVPDDAETAVSAMIAQNPEINGIYIPWSEGAMSAAVALRAADRTDVKVVTNDIGEDVALEMIKGDNIVTLTQCKAWQYGLTAVDLGCYGLLGKDIPAEAILIPGLSATKETIEEVWPEVFNEELPAQLKEALEQD